MSHCTHPSLLTVLRSLAVLAFYSPRHGGLRDLHSFPTRRSSDLQTPAPGCVSHTHSAARRISTRPTPRPFQSWRSEEHTSELQSPCNLVCRLLLEKKKINIILTLLDAAATTLSMSRRIYVPHTRL